MRAAPSPDRIRGRAASVPAQTDVVPAVGARRADAVAAVFADALPQRLAALVAAADGMPPASVREVWVAGAGGTATAERVLLVDAGDRSPDSLRRAGAALARAGADTVRLEVPPEWGPARTAHLVEGALLGGYRALGAPRTSRLELTEHADAPDVAAVRTTAAAALWARELTNTPAATASPAWLAGQAENVLAPLGVDVVVRDEQWLAERGFGGVLAVGGGSPRPPRLVEARWRPRGARGVSVPHFVLVGKGITFDTGGLNLKPTAGMRLMHTDMAGGAVVLSAVRAAAELALPVRVTALVPSAENSVSGSAYRPGDVIRHHGGRTTEVLNTDAEGRLVLADALAYAVGRRRPDRGDVVVDVATLTGAMRMTFGTGTAGLQASEDALASGAPGRRRPGRRAAVAVAAALGRGTAARLGRRGRQQRARRSRRHRGRTVPPAVHRRRAMGAPGRRRHLPCRRGRRRAHPRRHRLRGPAAGRLAARPRGAAGAGTPVTDPPDTVELVLPFVVRIERADPPGRTDALEAAALGVLAMLTTDRWPDEVARWDGQRIRKVVRRARGADWRRVLALDALTVTRGSAEVVVHPPIPVDAWPPELARLQVGGTVLTDPVPPAPPAPGTPLVLLSPHVEMTTGKAMAQAAHAAQLGWRAAGPRVRRGWQDAGFPVAVRDPTPELWARQVRAGAPVVRDAGFTEVDPGAETALFAVGQSSDW